MDNGNVKVARPLDGLARRVWLILGGLLAIVAVAACGASGSKPHSRLVSRCEPNVPHRYGCGGRPAHNLSCGLNATADTVATKLADATPGEVVCLASGDYSGFTGTRKSSPGITITSAPGAAVRFKSGIRLNLSSVRNFTLDGTGAGGTMTIGGELDMETNGDALQDKALNLTFANINFAAGGNVLIRGPENSNITFNRDTFVDANDNAACTGLGAKFYLLYSTATPTTASGVTVENSVFVAPGDLWNPDRAMETLSPMTVANNVIAGFLDRVDAASCNHVDGLLLYSGTGSESRYYGNVRFTGNLCYDDYNCIAGFDGTQRNTITDNACFNIEQNCVELESDTGSVINHNTQQTGGADPSGCAIQPNTQACTSSRLFMNSHKTGQPSTTGETYTTNADGSGPNIGDPGSITRNANNMWSGASSPNINGTATFAGGAHPTTWSGFQLKLGSTSHAGSRDGRELGIRASAGGPPTGGGSAPVNTVVPAVTGSPTESDTVTTTNGTWTITGNVPTATTYQWYDCPTSTFSARSCAPIQPHTFPTSANTMAYTLQASDVGHYVFSKVTVTNANGQVNTVSRGIGPIAS